MVPLAPIHPSVGKAYAPFPLPDSRVGWIGVNAAGKKCAVFYSHGTLIEVAEISGQVQSAGLSCVGSIEHTCTSTPRSQLGDLNTNL